VPNVVLRTTFSSLGVFKLSIKAVTYAFEVTADIFFASSLTISGDTF
jgi:hypothetical protein